MLCDVRADLLSCCASKARNDTQSVTIAPLAVDALHATTGDDAAHAWESCLDAFDAANNVKGTLVKVIEVAMQHVSTAQAHIDLCVETMELDLQQKQGVVGKGTRRPHN